MPDAKKPNILVIWGDDIGKAYLGCYTHRTAGTDVLLGWSRQAALKYRSNGLYRERVETHEDDIQ